MSFISKSLRNLQYLFTDVLWYYTLFAVLLKSLILLGFVISDNHSKLNLINAYTEMPSIAIYACFTIALLSIAFLLKGRKHLWYLVNFNIIVSVILITDLWYFRGFGTFISLHLLKQSANLDNLSGSIFSMARGIDLIFLLDIPVLLLVSILFKTPYRNMNRSVLLFLVLALAPVSYLSYVHQKVDIAENGQKHILFRICWTPNQTITNLSPVGYHIYDTYKFFADSKPLVLSPDEKASIKSWFDQKSEDLPDNSFKGLFNGKNLIMLQVESLENFVINQKIDGQEITPNLNRLLGNSLYFSNINEQVNEGTSSDADLMVNTSVYPLQRGSTFFRYPYNTYRSLPKFLQERGYSTTAIYPMKGAFWNWTDAMRSIGFENLLDISNFKEDEVIGLGISDGTYLRQTVSVVEAQKQPFHTHIVTLTSHGPFDIPDKYRELTLDPKLDQTKLGGYFQSIHYTDKQIGMFISMLKDKGLLDNTVIAVYGDHCGIHKYYQDELLDIQPGESWWLEKNNRIPLIIYQNQLTGEQISTTGGEIDLMPTISYLMGIEENKYKYSAMGRNLLKTKKNFAVLSDGQFIGKEADETIRQNAISGLDIAEKIIRSNFFKDN